MTRPPALSPSPKRTLEDAFGELSATQPPSPKRATGPLSPMSTGDAPGSPHPLGPSPQRRRDRPGVPQSRIVSLAKIQDFAQGIDEKNQSVLNKNTRFTASFRDDGGLSRGGARARAAALPAHRDMESFAGRSDNVRSVSGLEAPAHAGRFESEAQEYVKNRWTMSRSTAADQVSGTPYAELRADDLDDMPGGGPSRKKYGFQTGPLLKPPTWRKGLRINNPYAASPYYRSGPSYDMQGLCREIYDRVIPEEKRSEFVVFVNSRHAALDIDRMLDPAHPPGSPKHQGIKGKHDISSHIVALEFDDEAMAAKAQGHVSGIGAAPAPSHVIDASTPADQVEPVDIQVALDNRRGLSELCSDRPGSVFACIAAMPERHPAKPLARATMRLVDGLDKACSGRFGLPEHQHNAIVGNALGVLGNLLKAMPAVAGDSEYFQSTYQAMMEELNLVLAQLKPYEEAHFKSGALNALRTRAGQALDKLDIAPPEVFLGSSGTNVLSEAMRLAEEMHGTVGTGMLARHSNPTLPDYYQVPIMASALGEPEEDPRILAAPLNTSAPKKTSASDNANSWDAGKVVRETKKRLARPDISAKNPMTLVLDTTVEKIREDGQSDLAGVLDALKEDLNGGKLRIFLCKSYQKYSALASGKLLAGGITLLAKDDETTRSARQRMRSTEQELGWFEHEESQALTHFLTHGVKSEAEILQRAVDNASFVHQYCFGASTGAGTGFDRHEPGLPFGVVSNALRPFLLESNGLPAGQRTLMDFLNDEIEPRLSFAFAHTATCDVDYPAVRLALGQESQAELVEKLYGIGWLQRLPPGESITVDKVLEEIDAIHQQAFEAACRIGDLDKWADTALDILGKRSQGRREVADKVSECEGLRRRLRGRPPEAAAPERAALRRKLAAALERTEAMADDVKSDRMAIVNAALVVTMSDSTRRGDDLLAMRHEMALGAAPELGPGDGRDHFALRHARNRVASMLSLLSNTYANAEGADTDKIDALHEEAISTGLPGLSPASRKRVLHAGVHFALKGLPAPPPPGEPRTEEDDRATERRQQWLRKLVDRAHLLSHAEDKAQIFEHLPVAFFDEAGSHTQEALVKALFAPLDADTQGMLLGRLAEKPEAGKVVDACLQFAATELRDATQGWTRLLKPERVNELRASTPGEIATTSPVEQAMALLGALDDVDFDEDFDMDVDARSDDA